MNLQVLKYFVSLAKTKNYTKAAEECFVSQPALSRSISEFENKIGCDLVRKNSRPVELTEEGEVCLEESKKILKQWDTLVEKVTNTSKQFNQSIKIGYIIYGHIAVFNKRLSEVPGNALIKVETEYDSLFNVFEKLIANEIDMAILPKVCIPNSDFQTFDLSDSKLHVIIPRHNTLFSREYVYFNDLKDQKFIGWDPEEIPLLSEAHYKYCEEKGFKPKFIDYVKKMGDLMTLSILHNALGFAESHSTIVDLKEFKLIPIVDSEYKFGLTYAWLKDCKNPSVKKLIKILG